MRGRCFSTFALGLLLALPASADLGYVVCSQGHYAVPFNFNPIDYYFGSPIVLLSEGRYPYDATIKPDGSELWIPGAVGDGIIVIDHADSLIIARIDTGEYPVSIAFSNDGSLALVSCRDSDRLDLIDTASYGNIGSLPIPDDGSGPGHLALDPSTGNFYLVEWYGNLLYEIAPDASAILRQASLGSNLWQVVVDPDGSTVYVTDRGNDHLRAIDRATFLEVNALLVGDDPWGLDITLDGGTLVVVSEDDQSLGILDVASWTAAWVTLPIDCEARDVDIHDATGKALVPTGEWNGFDGVIEVDLATAMVSGILRFADPWWGSSPNPNAIAVQPQMAASSTAAPAALAGLRLSAQPNPFTPSTRLHFALPVAGPTRLSLFDIQGRELGILLDGWQAAGERSLPWEGRDGQGRALPAGLYFARLTSAGGAETVKLLLLK
jgi:YVTN family beta-propeller protein